MTPHDLAVTSSFVPVMNGTLHVVELRPIQFEGSLSHAGEHVAASGRASNDSERRRAVASVREAFDLQLTKTAVVLIHGFPETWWSWRHQLGALAAQGHHVLAVDLRGYGESTRSGPFDLNTLAADVAEVIRVRAGGRAAVVGHDWGGATAWTLAARHPERVSHVVVINCPLPKIMQERLVRRPSWAQLKRSWYIFFFQVPLLPEHLISKNGGRSVAAMIRRSAKVHDHMSDAELAPFCEAASTPAAVRGMLAPYRAALRGVVTMEALPPITMPAMLIWGRDDPALGFDELVPETARLVPGLQVEALAGCGHFPHSERPERVNRLVSDFID